SRNTLVQIIERAFERGDDEAAVAQIFIVSQAVKCAADFSAGGLKLENHLPQIGVAIFPKQPALVAEMPHRHCALEGAFGQRMMNVTVFVTRPINTFSNWIRFERRALARSLRSNRIQL